MPLVLLAQQVILKQNFGNIRKSISSKNEFQLISPIFINHWIVNAKFIPIQEGIFNLFLGAAFIVNPGEY